MEIYNLIIEVTRKCNMVCNHCLRGKAQNKNIPLEYIDKLLNAVTYISTVTFTGGEPSLNPKAIEYFTEQCKLKSVGVGSFFIATNSKQVSDEFLVALIKLYAFCDEKEMCSLGISNDQFHDTDSHNIELLKVFSFTNERYNGNRDLNNLLNEGFFAENYNMGYDVRPDEIMIDEDRISEGAIYLNVNGKIVNGCDWSYANQNKNIICDVDDLSLDSINQYVADNYL